MGKLYIVKQRGFTKVDGRRVTSAKVFQSRSGASAYARRRGTRKIGIQTTVGNYFGKSGRRLKKRPKTTTKFVTIKRRAKAKRKTTRRKKGKR